MKRFLIVDDHSSCAIWDNFLVTVVRTLKSRPNVDGWERWTSAPQGDWTVSNAMNAMMIPDSAYINFGVRVPRYDELPMIFVLNADGSVEEQTRITAQQAGEFIDARV